MTANQEVAQLFIGRVFSPAGHLRNNNDLSLWGLYLERKVPGQSQRWSYPSGTETAGQAPPQMVKSDCVPVEMFYSGYGFYCRILLKAETSELCVVGPLPRGSNKQLGHCSVKGHVAAIQSGLRPPFS